MKKVAKTLLVLAVVLGLVWFAAPMVIVFPALAASSALDENFPGICSRDPVANAGPLVGLEEGMTVEDAMAAYQTHRDAYWPAWQYLEVRTQPADPGLWRIER
jgi:hypothetical protein